MKIFALFLLLAVLPACNSITFPDLSGDYAGSWWLNGASSAVTATVTKPITSAKKEVITDIQLLSVLDKKVSTIRVVYSEQNKDELLLQFLHTSIPSISLTLHGTCADSQSSQEYVEFCWTSNNISLVRKNEKGALVSGLSLRKNDGLPDYGDPSRSITLSYDQLIERAKNSTYNVAEKAERVYRARNNIRIARSNLLPHFSGRSIISMILFPASGFGLIDTIGNLIPFIFPANWYKVEEAKFMADAEKYSYQSLIANEVNVEEALYIAIARDQSLFAETKKFLEKGHAILDSALQLQRLGILDPSVVKEMEAILRDHEQDNQNLQFLIQEELVQLSGALAVSPVTSIVAVESLPDRDFSKESPVASSSLISEAKVKSLEMYTLQSLIRSSGSELNALNYSVINPSDFVSIDFSLGAKTGNVVSSIRELQFQVDAVLSAVEENSVSAANHYNLILQTDTSLRAEAEAKSSYLQDLYRRAEVQSISPRDFFYAERAMFEVRFKSLENLYEFYLVRGKIQRLSLTGVYEPQTGKAARLR